MALIDELTAIASASEIVASRTDFGLTVVNFNVQRWTSLINTFGGIAGEDFQTEQWDAQPHVRLIARYLERHNADVIVMQEAWDCEYILPEMADLGYLGIGSIDTRETMTLGIGYPLGSGLAFFSRHPFRRLGDVGLADANFSYSLTKDVISIAESPAGELPTGARILARKGWLRLVPGPGPGSIPIISEVPADHVAFHKFEHASGIDALAAKGVAMVKIDFADSVVTIVGTHLNAGSDETKSQQFDEINQFLQRNLSASENEWGHVLFAGDLNTRGDHEADHSAWDEHLQPSTDPSATLLRRHFIDTWDQFAYPPLWRQNDPAVIPAAWVERTDPCDTAGIFNTIEDRSRIDYILWHPATRPDFAVAHPRVLNDAIAESGPRSGAALSDHWPYAVQFVTNDDFASPSRPLRVDGTAPQVISTSSDSRIALGTPSSVQWFVVLEPGSYAIHASPIGTSGEVVTEVYRASNLSSPELPAPGELLDIRDIIDTNEEVFASEYRWRPEPIFIKVFQRIPEAGQPDIQEYRLVVVPLNGSTPALAPVVSPGVTVDWGIGAQVAIPSPGLIGEIWFKYATIGPFNHLGRPQVLDLHARTVDGTGSEVHANRLAIFERTASGLPGGVISAAQVAEGAAEPADGAKTLTIQDRNENWKRRLVRIEIPDSVAAGQRIQFGWRTDLSVVPFPAFSDSRRLRLHCRETTDGWPAGDDDDVRLQLTVDGITVFPESNRPNLGDFGDNQSRSIDHVVGCAIGFFDFIDISLSESDSFLTFGDDFLAGANPIEELDPSVQEETEFAIEISGDGGKYTLSGSVARFSPEDCSLKPGTAGPGDVVDCKSSEL